MYYSECWFWRSAGVIRMRRFFEVWRSSYDPVWHSPILELFGLTSVIGRITHFVLAEGAWGGGGDGEAPA